MWLFYLFDMVDLLHNEWDLGKKASKSSGKICAWIYLFDILGCSEQIYIKVINKKLIGFSSYTYYKSKKHFFRKILFRTLTKFLWKSKKIKNKKALENYHHDYDFIPEKLRGYFDGEISILIVDKEHRGKSYGSKLLKKCFKDAKKRGIKKIQILSDESCNYKFYEFMGCKKIAEVRIKSGEPGRIKEENYIYEKIL